MSSKESLIFSLLDAFIDLFYFFGGAYLLSEFIVGDQTSQLYLWFGIIAFTFGFIKVFKNTSGAFND